MAGDGCRKILPGSHCMQTCQGTPRVWHTGGVLALAGGWGRGTVTPELKEAVLKIQLWTTVWQFLKQINMELPYDPAIPLLVTHPRETTTYIHTKTCTRMFIAALFTIAKKWKQPNCPLTDVWINRMWSIRTMEYYSAK